MGGGGGRKKILEGMTIGFFQAGQPGMKPLENTSTLIWESTDKTYRWKPMSAIFTKMAGLNLHVFCLAKLPDFILQQNC